MTDSQIELCLQAQFIEYFERTPEEGECTIEFIEGSCAVIRLNVHSSEKKGVEDFLSLFLGSYDRYLNTPVRRYTKDRIKVTVEVFIPFTNFLKGLS